MHHPSARQVVARILAGTAFGDRALALCLAADVEEAPGGGEALRARLLERAGRMPADQAPPLPQVDAPLPDDAAALGRQLAPAIVRRPHDVGFQLAALDALCRLWPHAVGSERAALRLRFLAMSAHRPAPESSVVTSEQLRAWQRDLPTTWCEEQPSVASLRALLDESRAQGAYRVLADHLGCCMDLAALHRVLGSLAGGVLLGRRDPQGWLARALLGAVAAGRLVPLVDPEQLAAVTCQLAHQLWWCRNAAELPSVRISIGADALPLPAALRCGDITAAQRAARSACTQPERLWSAVWAFVDEAVAWDDQAWLRALATANAFAWRSGASVPPDDAAALASVLADLAYRRSLRPVAMT